MSVSNSKYEPKYTLKKLEDNLKNESKDLGKFPLINYSY